MEPPRTPPRPSGPSSRISPHGRQSSLTNLMDTVSPARRVLRKITSDTSLNAESEVCRLRFFLLAKRRNAATATLTALGFGSRACVGRPWDLRHFYTAR